MMQLPTPERLWYERLRRAMDREGLTHRVREWAGDMLALSARRAALMRIDENGSVRWVPNPAARDKEATERAKAERMDQLGIELGIGPRPRP